MTYKRQLKMALGATTALVLATGQLQASDEVVIGLATASSGFMTAYDGGPSQSVEMFIEEVNAKGGLLGKTLKLVKSDTKSDIAQGAKAGIDVLDQGAQMAIVSCDYDFGAPAANEIQKAGKISFFTCADDVKAGVVGVGPASFTAGIAAVAQGAAIAQWGAEKKGFKSAYILRDTSIEYNKSVCNGFEWMIGQMQGVTLLGQDTWTNSDPSISSHADLLPVLGIQPLMGRGFTKDEDHSETPRTVLLSYSFWQTRFGGDPSVLGRVLTLDRVPYTVIGVVPDMQAFMENAQLFVPLSWTATNRATRSNHNYRGIAKLKPGVDVARANADMDTISKRLEAQYPDENAGWGTLIRPLQEDMVGNVRSSLMVLLGSVALVLLIACANLANLMLVRTHGRAKEIAVRGALGASRLRVVQQLLAEGLVLGIGGGVAGLAAAYFGVDILKAAFEGALPRANEVAVDTRVLFFTAAIAMLTGLLAAFAPAWQLTGRDANDALKTGPGRGNSSGGDGRVRNVLVISEVALALMLLIGAGLLMRSLTSLRGVDAGFDASNVLTGMVQIPEAKYTTPEARIQFYERVAERVRALPGVQSAAWVDNLPMEGGSSQYVSYDGLPPMKESEMPVVAVRLPSPGYFGTAKIPIISGRDFADADRLGRPRVVIVSQRTAERFFPGQDPLGKHITLLMMTKEPAEIVGVVKEVKMGALDASADDSETAVYAPMAQFGYNGSTIVVRTAGDPSALTPSLVSAVKSIDAEQPVMFIKTLDSVVEESLGQRPLAMLLLTMFAVLALVLATVGIYSVLAYTVRQRVREIGIRMALGAPAKGVLRLIVIEGLKPTLIGVVVGLVLAAMLVRVMATLLFGVSQHDPGTFSTVTVIMIVVGILATLLPAWRATRVDPIVTLRSE